MTPNISRRTVLKGIGAAVALPWLESLEAMAAPAIGATKVAPPLRSAFFYVPNGIHLPDFKPAVEGKTWDMPWTLEPLKAFRSQMNVLSGLDLDKAKANGDGGGDHARAMAAFLTGSQPRKTSGADIRVGRSADQQLANGIGDATKFSSLELGIERGLNAGNCDSGYSCAYSANLSWRSESTPNAKECDPKAVFERLFGSTDASKESAAARAKRDAYSKSVLDFVMDDARAIQGQLSGADVRKVDEYMTSIREIETRIQRSQDIKSRKVSAPTDFKQPTGIPKEKLDHIHLMCDLAVLSFQTDLTRVLTMPFANDGSNQAYSMIGVKEGHHDLSHHGRDKAKQEKIRQINRFHVEQFAYFIGKMAATKEGDKSLLDSSMIVYGAGIGDGDRHNHDDLPILLLGSGNGTIEGGRHVRYAKGTPLMNLYMAMFEKAGCPAPRFGDSTGVLKI